MQITVNSYCMDSRCNAYIVLTAVVVLTSIYHANMSAISNRPYPFPLPYLFLCQIQICPTYFTFLDLPFSANYSVLDF